MPRIHLNVIGPPEATRDGQPRKLYLKDLAVMAYLALEGRTQRRRLAQLLWPDAPDPLNNLSAARTHIIKELGDAALEADPDTLTLPDHVTCDARIWRSDATGDQDRWDAWRGDFLQGLRFREWASGLGEEFEEWLEDTRARFRSERRDAATRLATHAIARHDLDTARTLLEVACGDPDDPREDAARLLMLVHGALGHADRAALTYQHLTRALQDALDVEPTPATTDALHLARAGSTDACLTALRERLPAASDEGSGEVAGNAPFVGREAEYRTLLDTLRPDGSRPVRVAVLTGEPGAGKTHLASELARAFAPTAHALDTTASPGGLPLAVIDTLARNALLARPNALEVLPPAWRDALARFLPDALTPGGPPPAPDVERRNLYYAIRGVLEHPARPTLLLVDDLQWADDATLEFLTFLLTNPPARGLTLLATLRDTETPRGNLSPLLERVTRNGLGVIQPVPPLTTADITALAEALGRQVNPDELERMTGGNAFYLTELLRADASGHGNATTPERVQDLIRTRLGGLEAPERQSLEALAVLAGPAPVSLLRRVSGRTMEETALALDQLHRAGLVNTDPSSTSFHHDLTREVVLGDLSSTRCHLLHLRAARALKDHPLQAARHYWTARDLLEDDDQHAAFQTFTRTATAVALRGDLREALLWLDRAESVTENPESIAAAAVHRAELLERYGQHQDALRALDAARPAVDGSRSVTLRARAGVARATILTRELGKPAEAHALLEDVLRFLDGATGFEADGVRGDTLNLLGHAAFQLGQYDQARERFDGALTIRQALGDRYRVAETLAGLGMIAFVLGQPDAERLLLECLTIREQIGDTIGVAKSLTNLGNVYERQGRYHEALALYERAQPIYAENNGWFGLTRSLINIGAIHFRLSRYETARAFYARALQISRQQQLQITEELHLNLAEVEFRLGRHTEAMAYMRTFWAAAEANGRAGAAIAVRGHLLHAELHRVCGATAEAKERLKNALVVARECRRPDLLAFAEFIHALEAGHTEAAQACLRQGDMRSEDYMAARVLLAQVRQDVHELQTVLRLTNDRWLQATILCSLSELLPQEAQDFQAQADVALRELAT